ncbi:MAG: phospholipase D-like domain-containing protein [Saprospiraceae bacterium]
MNTAYFQNLPEHLCGYLSQAKHSICAAVCWFSHKEVFDTLLERLRGGVRVELLLEYDNQNIREGGLDFQAFVRKNGQLWAGSAAGLMHHKFAVVDDRLLLSGSFNWTYNSNAENLMATDDATLLAAFKAEFERQKAAAKRIFQVRRADVKVFAAFPLFENTQFPLADLRKKVSQGANVWLVRLDKLKKEQRVVFSEHQIPFDTANLLAPFWTAFRMWDQELFEEEMTRIKSEFPENLLRDLRCWAQRMKIGDLIFGVDRNLVPVKDPSRNSTTAYLLAVGIIQSHPQPFTGEGFSTFRSVQWLKIMEEMPYLLPEKTSGQMVAKYRGSALRVLQEVFGG